MDHVLAIDQGTHASRALLFDAQGRQVGGGLSRLDGLPVARCEPQADAALRACYRRFVDRIRQLTEDTDGH